MLKKIRGTSLVEAAVVAIVATLIIGIIMATIGGAISFFQSEPGNSPWAQSWARRWGAAYSINLPPGEHLLTVVWHGDQMWHLTRPMEQGEHPRVLHFKEKSRWGIMQGHVTINEMPLVPVTTGR